MKMLDLFSGIGGFSLAASWTGSIETVAFCEIDPYCQKVLYKHWPDVPIYPDIKELRGEDVGSVDIVCGGFPCQPFSCAGKQRGKEDDRYLWPEMFRVIQEAHPTWVISENVAGFVNMGLDDCISDLESEGYEVQPLVIPACAVNAPHRRDRVWIIAYNNAIRRDVWGHQRQGIQRRDKTCDEADSSSETMADTNRTRELQPQGSIQELRGWISDGGKDVAYPERQGSQRLSICEMEGASQFTKGSWWDVEPNVGRVANGIPHRVDRLKGLGNAIVPQVVYPIFQTIIDIENQIKT